MEAGFKIFSTRQDLSTADVVADDEFNMVGTISTDYRSLVQNAVRCIIRRVFSYQGRFWNHFEASEEIPSWKSW